MKSPIPLHHPLIDQLRDRALAVVGRHRPEALSAYIDAGKEDDQADRAELDHLHTVTTSGSPPPELTSALRSPRGAQRLVSLHVHGRYVRTVINPNGCASPARERAVWIQICSVALTIAAV